jgi:hypothetical protein
MKEAMEAGRIVGIQVNISLEFSISVHGKRFHFMAMLPLQEPQGAGPLV